ncbi:MAG: hypothetical protein WB992_20315 [Bryobacteraceae bacterium]
MNLNISKSYLVSFCTAALLMSAATAQLGSAQTRSSVTTLFDANYNAVRTDYISTDLHVHEMFLSGATWSDADLTGLAGGVAVSSGTGLASTLDPVYNAVRDYYVGTDQHVHELFLNNGFWSDGDITTITGTSSLATAGALASVFDPTFQAVRTDYVSTTDMHVHEMFLSGSTWSDADLTVLAGASGAVAVSAGSGLVSIIDAGGRARNYYIGSDTHVHQLFLINSFWSDQDLTMVTGGPDAAANSALARIIDPNYFGAVAARLYYISTDQHVHEMFLQSSTWSDTDLTALTGATEAAAVESSLASLYDYKYMAVRTDYLGTDLHVHELYLYGATWSDADLTGIGGGVAATAGSGLASTLDPVYNGAVRDYYIGTDLNVHELFLDNGVWSDGDITGITGGPTTAAVKSSGTDVK